MGTENTNFQLFRLESMSCAQTRPDFSVTSWQTCLCRPIMMVRVQQRPAHPFSSSQRTKNRMMPAIAIHVEELLCEFGQPGLISGRSPQAMNPTNGRPSVGTSSGPIRPKDPRTSFQFAGQSCRTRLVKTEFSRLVSLSVSVCHPWSYPHPPY